MKAKPLGSVKTEFKTMIPGLKLSIELPIYTPLTADEQEGGETVNIKSSDMDDFNNSEEIAMNEMQSPELLQVLEQMQAQKQMQARYAKLFVTEERQIYLSLRARLGLAPSFTAAELLDAWDRFFGEQAALIEERSDVRKERKALKAKLDAIDSELEDISSAFEDLKGLDRDEYNSVKAEIAKIYAAGRKKQRKQELSQLHARKNELLAEFGDELTEEQFDAYVGELKDEQSQLFAKKNSSIEQLGALGKTLSDLQSKILTEKQVAPLKKMKNEFILAEGKKLGSEDFAEMLSEIEKAFASHVDALTSQDYELVIDSKSKFDKEVKQLLAVFENDYRQAGDDLLERGAVIEQQRLFKELREQWKLVLSGEEFKKAYQVASSLKRWNAGRMGLAQSRAYSKKHFEKAFKRATNACLNAIAQIRDENKRDKLLTKVTGDTVVEVTRAAVQQMRLRLRTAGSAYQAMRAIKLKLYEAANGKLCVSFDEGSQGRIETGAQPIQKILGDSSFLSQIVVWEYDTSSIKDKRDANHVWEAVANVCRPEKFLPVANNGSRALIKLVGDDGELSTVAKFMDALFENFSQVGAYGLSLLNAAPESPVSDANETQINCGKDGDGRKTTVILYDANALDWMPGVDGAALSSVGSSFQHRSFAMKFDDNGKPRFELGAAFFKGLQADSRICMRDGKPWSVSDLINLGKLTDEEFKEKFNLEKTDDNIESVMQEFGHFNLPNATNSQEYSARIQRWDEWFNANSDLDRVYGLEVGMLKGKGKKGMAKLVDSLVGKNIEEGSSIKDILKATGGWFEVDCPVYGWSIIDSPEKSSTSMNYQPQSVLIYTEDGLAKLKQSYESKTSEFIERFSARAMRERDSDRYDRLGILMSQVFGKKLNEASNLMAWPQAVVKNPVGSFHRWCFNFDKTSTPTKRVVMVDHGEHSYTGLMLVDDALLRRERAKQAKSSGERLLDRLVRGCTWRGPLIVPGAAQAPWMISGKLAAWLLDQLEKKNAGSTISEHAEEQLQIIVDRIAFKRDTYDKGNWNEDKVWSLLEGILRNVVKDASLVKMGNELVIMDRRDVEAMQGDDDGDTVVVETDPDTVQRFADAEIFWKKFYEANGLRPLQIEMSKGNQIDFALANSVYNGVSYDQLSDKAKTLVDVFGVECPEIAEQFGLPGSKIPSPLGLNFALIHELNEKTNDGVWKHLARFGFKLGSTPTGPIGAFANEGPDFLVRALRETNENLVLTEYGKRLWQGYALASSGLQVSIDWTKRVYEILNAALYDLICALSGEFKVNFEKELTPEAIKEVLVSNTFGEVKIVRFKYDRHDGKTDKGKDKWVKDGHKLVRVVIVNDSCGRRTKPDTSQANAIDTINGLDTTVIHYWTQSEFDTLKSASGTFSLDDKMIRVGDSTKVTDVSLMDMGNGCFDFDSVFALGSFMLQRQIKQGYVPGEFEQNVAAWKVDIAELLGKKREEALGALNKSYHRSSLTAHVTQFLEYTEDNDSIKQMLSVMPECTALAGGENAKGMWLDSRWNDVRIATAAFFDAMGGGHKGREMDKSSVVRAALKEFGVPGKIMDDFLQDNASFSFNLDGEEVKTTLADVVACLMRNDKKYEDEKVPQNLTQMVIGEYLDRSEPNPFMQVCTEAADHFMAPVYGVLGHEFVSKRNGKEIKSSMSFYKSFNKFLNAGLVKTLVPESERNSFDNRFLSREQRQSKDGQDYLHFAWKSSRDFWLGMAEIVDYGKQALLGDDKLWATLENLYETSLAATYDSELAELDFAGVQRQFESATRLMIASYDQAIRTFRAYANERSVVPELFEGSKRSKLARIYSSSPELAQRDLNSRNFLGSGMSIKRRLDAMTQSRSVTRLPEAQANRETQQQIIHNLVKGGCLVKSWSYFADSTWRSEFEVKMLYLADTHQQRFDGNGKLVFDASAEIPVSCFIRQCSILRMAGKPVEKYLALNNKDTMYQGAKEYFTAVRVGNSERLVWNSQSPSLLAETMIAEDILLKAIKYLQDGEKNYGRWKDNPPAGSGLTIVRGGKAIAYDGKEYFYEDALITKLLKKVRFSK